VTNVSGRPHRNIAAVALANKNARIAWAVLSRGGTFDPEHGQRLAESPGHVRSGQE
jgi:transposase